MVFADLKFEQHPNRMQGSVQAKHTFPNGITISVVGGEGLYGDGKESFEVAAWIGESEKHWLKLADWDDVLGWRSKDEVEKIIQSVSQMNPNKEILKQQLKESVTEIENFEQEIEFHKQKIAEIKEKLKEM